MRSMNAPHPHQDSSLLTGALETDGHSSLSNSILPASSAAITKESVQSVSPTTSDCSGSGAPWMGGGEYTRGNSWSKQSNHMADRGEPSDLSKVHIDPNYICEEVHSDSSEDTHAALPVSGPGSNSRFGGFRPASCLSFSVSGSSKTHVTASCDASPSPTTSNARPAEEEPGSLSTGRRCRSTVNVAKPLPRITSFFQSCVITIFIHKPLLT